MMTWRLARLLVRWPKAGQGAQGEVDTWIFANDFFDPRNDVVKPTFIEFLGRSQLLLSFDDF